MSDEVDISELSLEELEEEVARRYEERRDFLRKNHAQIKSELEDYCDEHYGLGFTEMGFKVLVIDNGLPQAWAWPSRPKAAE